MPIIRRTQPAAWRPPASYPLASTAAQLAQRGLSPRQVDAAHPRLAPVRGASYTRGTVRAGAARPQTRPLRIVRRPGA